MAIKVILKSGKDVSVRRFHPWVFSGAIKKMKGDPEEGDLVELYDNKEEFLGIGHYQIGSIAVRVLSFQPREINYEFWLEKIRNAYNYRKSLNLIDNKNTNVYRLIHAEGDELPGLIVDVYNGTAVMQMHSIGMYLAKEEIARAIKEVMGNHIKAIYNKSDSTIPHKSKIKAVNEYLFGQSDATVVTENGNLFKVDWVEGQKTGFFIDQRENRELLAKYSKGKAVLNMFGYTGGFSVYAAKSGATLVHSVDSSKRAIDMTNENMALNFPEGFNHESFAIDASEHLQNIQDKYDVIILDPPAFAKHNDVLANAMQGYKRLNQKAFEVIKKDGILFTFSCSQVVTKELFRKAVFMAAAQTGRTVRILHQLTQPADHPINIYHQEGEYLKGLVLHVS